MIDFIEAIKFDDKDTFFSGHLQIEASYIGGNTRYSLKGVDGRNFQIIYNPSTKLLVVKGSIMYYYQGHNFTYDKRKFVEAIQHISTLIHVPLWDSDVRIFEYGAIMPVDMPPKEIISHHREGKGQTLSINPNGLFRSFDDSFCRRKLYDAGRNIQHKQGLTMKGIIEDAGWNPKGYYIKWECHYLKPEYLNHGVAIKLKDLVNPDWENVFRKDVYEQYKKVLPFKSIDMSKTDGKPFTLDIAILMLAETLLNNGSTLDEVRKMLYGRINAMGELSQSDKDARKRKVKEVFEKLKTSDKSQWDISNLLKKALSIEDEASSIPDGDSSGDGEALNQ
ncbi:MAG: hypothetical protein LIP09_11475 [Bacteroidales bacterium]|nr:hypothetical protein [Bacteroidales bacterium]